ncbi:hypothetical protein MRB53_038377 [Persea americana]|nr:hypothetical protein MRB53_038377 [Persea americana]
MLVAENRGQHCHLGPIASIGRREAPSHEATLCHPYDGLPHQTSGTGSCVGVLSRAGRRESQTMLDSQRTRQAA